MPQWFQILLAASAGIAALGVIWSKVIRPILRFSARSEEMVPLLRQLTAEFRDTPGAFAILDEIVKQVRTDSGSSLLDIVNRLDAATVANAAAAEVLKVGVQSAKELAEQDRVLLQLLIKQIDHIAVKIESAATTATKVADNLAVAQHAVDTVATDLAASQKRADGANGDDHGAAADASAKSPRPEPEDR